MSRLRVALASGDDRETIYRLRHAVYAGELGQHSVNEEGRLRDALDDFNEYVVVRQGGEVAGFVSLTPPGRNGYSIDKYFAREDLPFAFDEGLWEVRLLTVPSRHRGRALAFLLMYAAFRLAASRGGTRIVAIGRHTRVWVDEAYVDYAGSAESVERLAAESGNVVVCKSLSKVYALSGARAAYLCGPPALAQELRRLTPPWAVSLPAQVAAVAALRDPEYYAERYRETAELRRELAAR